ncbi:MAG: YceI family protein [Bacteroidota bacterium]
MKILFLSLVLGSVALTSSCKKEKTESKETYTIAKPSAENGTIYALDLNESVVNWSGSKPGGKHTGTIKLKEGFVTIKDSIVTSGRFFMDMNTITVTDLKPEEGKSDLENHLKGLGDKKKKDHFFNVTKYPSSDFKITKVEKAEGNVLIYGNLSIKGITKAVNFPATLTINDKEVIIDSDKLVLNRTYFNVKYASKSVFGDLKDKFINDEIEIQVKVKANRQ